MKLKDVIMNILTFGIARKNQQEQANESAQIEAIRLLLKNYEALLQEYSAILDRVYIQSLIIKAMHAVVHEK